MKKLLLFILMLAPLGAEAREPVTGFDYAKLGAGAVVMLAGAGGAYYFFEKAAQAEDIKQRQRNKLYGWFCVAVAGAGGAYSAYKIFDIATAPSTNPQTDEELSTNPQTDEELFNKYLAGLRIVSDEKSVQKVIEDEGFRNSYSAYNFFRGDIKGHVNQGKLSYKEAEKLTSRVRDELLKYQEKNSEVFPDFRATAELVEEDIKKYFTNKQKRANDTKEERDKLEGN